MVCMYLCMISPKNKNYQILNTINLFKKNDRLARDRLKKAATKRKSPVLMDSYRQVRNRVNTLNVQLKKEYYTNKRFYGF